MLNLDDPANRRVVELFAKRDQRDEPLDEPAYYPPIEHLTTHPDVIDRVWKTLGGALPPTCGRFVHGVACLVHDRSGIVLAFGWGTEYTVRLRRPDLAAALLTGASPTKKWAGGDVTDLSAELGPDWVWGYFTDAEPQWIAAAYGAFSGCQFSI